MLDDIKKTLWATADKLRAHMDAAEYKHLVLGLIFLKYVSDTFTARRAEIEARQQNPADEFYFPDASAEDLAAELEDRGHHKSVNVFWLPEGARWETIRSRYVGHLRSVSAIVWNAVRDGKGITVRHQWNA